MRSEEARTRTDQELRYMNKQRRRELRKPPSDADCYRIAVKIIESEKRRDGK